MKDKTIQRVLAVFFAIAAVLMVVAIVAVRNVNRAIASSDWVNHTHAVIMEADAIQSSLHAGDGALRAFLLTGDARDKGASREAFGAMSEHFEVARALTTDEPAQAAKFAHLQAMLNQRMGFARQAVAAREADDAGAVRGLLAADAGGGGMQEIVRLIETLKQEEKDLLAERDKASYLQAQTTRWTVGSGVVINVILLAGVAWLIRDDISARRRATAVLAEANATLESKVRERTAELAATIEKLLAENQERRWSGQSLEHQLRYSQLIFNSISDVVMVLSKAINITRVNPAASRWTGLAATEMISKPLSRVVRVAPADAGTLDPVAQAIKDGHELHEQPATVIAGDGRTHPARLSLFPLRDRDRVVGAVVSIRIVANAA
jgi:PAS domain S-box-containing protein